MRIILCICLMTSFVSADWWTSTKKRITQSYQRKSRKNSLSCYHTHKRKDNTIYGHTHWFEYVGKYNQNSVETYKHLHSVHHLNALAKRSDYDQRVQQRNEMHIHHYDHTRPQRALKQPVIVKRPASKKVFVKPKKAIIKNSLEIRMIKGHEYIIITKDGAVSTTHSASCPCKASKQK